MATVESTLEDTLYAIKTHVEGNFSSYVVAMNSLKSDSAVIENIKVHVVGDLEVLKQPRYPIALYYPTEITVEALDLGDDEIRMEVYLAIVLRGASDDKLTTKALRYSDCLRQLVNDDHTLGGACDYARVSRVNYYASEPGTENLMEIENTLSVIITVTN